MSLSRDSYSLHGAKNAGIAKKGFFNGIMGTRNKATNLSSRDNLNSSNLPANENKNMTNIINRSIVTEA